jgi:hypothetical protein
MMDFTDTDLKRFQQLLNTANYPYPIARGIIVSDIVPTDSCKEYDIDDDGLYIIFGRTAWKKMLQIAKIRPATQNIYPTTMNIPVIDSDSKAKEILEKAELQRDILLFRLRLWKPIITNPIITGI